MTKAEFIMVKSVIEGPMQLPWEEVYTLVCSIETQDGKTAVDEIKGTFEDCYGVKKGLDLYGPVTIEATWTEDASDL